MESKRQSYFISICLGLLVSQTLFALPLKCPVDSAAPTSTKYCQQYANSYTKRLHHIEYYCQQPAYRKRCSALIAKPYAKYLSQSMQDAFVLTSRMALLEKRWPQKNWQTIIAPAWQPADLTDKKALKIDHDRDEYRLAIKALEAIDKSLQTFGLQVGLLVQPKYNKVIKSARHAQFDAQTQLRKVLQGCASNADISAQCYHLDLPTKADNLTQLIASLTADLVDAIPQTKKVIRITRRQQRAMHQLADIVTIVGLLNEKDVLIKQSDTDLKSTQIRPQATLYKIQTICSQPGIKNHCDQTLGNYPQDIVSQISQLSITKPSLHTSQPIKNIHRLRQQLKKELAKLRTVSRKTALANRRQAQLLNELSQIEQWGLAVQQLVQANRMVRHIVDDSQDIQENIDVICSSPKLTSACSEIFGSQQTQTTLTKVQFNKIMTSLAAIDEQLQHHWHGVNLADTSQQLSTLTKQAQTQLMQLMTAYHQARLLHRGMIEQAGQLSTQHALDRRMLIEDYLDAAVNAEQQAIGSLATMTSVIPLTDCHQLTDHRRTKHCQARQKVARYLNQSVALLPSIEQQKHHLRRLRDQLSPSSCRSDSCIKADELVTQATAAKNMILLKAQIIAGFTAAANKLKVLGG